MWKLFSRKSDVAIAPAEPVFTPANRSAIKINIAEIELMGATAVATLTVTELSRDHGAELLAGLLDELASSGATHFVLDIQNVQFMDSTCLGCLVEALNRLAATGGRIALVNADHSVAYLFRMTRLDRVFPVCTDVMAALKAVEREPGATNDD